MAARQRPFEGVMEFLVGAFVAGCAVAGTWVAYWFDPDARMRVKIRRAPREKIADVNGGKICKIVGRARFVGRFVGRALDGDSDFWLVDDSGEALIRMTGAQSLL